MGVSMRNILSSNSAYDSNKHKITDREIIFGRPLFAYPRIQQQVLLVLREDEVTACKFLLINLYLAIPALV